MMVDIASVQCYDLDVRLGAGNAGTATKKENNEITL
jgi:hypothetical protein